MNSLSCRSLAWLVIVASPLTLGVAQQPMEDWEPMLRNDARLKAAVSYNFPPSPSAANILGSIHKATGVPLSVAGPIEQDKFILGTTSAVNVPAWKVMEIVARRQVVNGKWEKSGDGYVLYGRPMNFGPAQNPEQVRELKEAFEKAKAKAIADQQNFVKFHPLGLDERLRPRMNVEKHPKLPDLLQQLQSLTGLKFTVAPDLTYHDPDLGVVQQPATMAAYMVMEFVLDKDLENGKWEKTADGYMLTGTSRALKPPPSRPVWPWPARYGLIFTPSRPSFRTSASSKGAMSRPARSKNASPSPLKKPRPLSGTSSG